MSKLTPIPVEEVTPELIAEISEVLNQGKAHKYSAGKVFAAHNKLFNLAAKPDTCTTCVLRRFKDLYDWHKANADKFGEPTDEAVTQLITLAENGGVIKFTAATPEADKGVVTWEDGKKVKAGDYTDANGNVITVDKNGNAVIMNLY